MTIPEQQAEVAAFLKNLTGSAPSETHISAVFVGPHDVYKLKKAVRLSFLDFSQVAARGVMARREFCLNRVAAPDIYRGVKVIVRAPDGTLRLADDDAPDAVDYVVHMAPIPHGDFLDQIVARHDQTPEMLDALGDCVADLHGNLEPVANWDSAGGMRHIIDGNVAAAHDAGLAENIVSIWCHSICAEIDRLAPTLATRAAAGRVRRLHGDLHLGNICLWHGRPTAFDMLEFDESLATADVGYDLAFLLMDLSFHAGRAAANRVMNRYIARTGDVGLLAALPCFMSIRAIVRAHVQASRGAQQDATRYMQMALDSLESQPPILVAVGGLQGTGKTTLARALAPDLGRMPGACVLRSDEIRKRLFHTLPEQKLPRDAYTAGANARVNAALVADIATALRAGQAVIADCTFLHEPLRHAAEAAARLAHCPFVGFWLEADLETLVARVGARARDASDAGPDIVRHASGVDAGHVTWRRVLAVDGSRALEEVRKNILF